MNKRIKIITILAVTSTIISCSNTKLESYLPDNRPDYKTSRSINDLEVPPDLTSATINDTMAIPELSAVNKNSQGKDTGNTKTTLSTGLKNIHSIGNTHWIEIAENPDAIYRSIKNYWRNADLKLTRDDQEIGIMETDWLEPKNNRPSSFITGYLRKIIDGMSDDGLRDKFRVRVDYDGKKTLVYLTHYGIVEKEFKDKYGPNSDTSEFAWVDGKRNPELEIEMLRRISVYLNKKQKVLTADNNSTKETNLETTSLTDGTPAIIVNGNYNEAWILLGIAVDRAGFKIRKQDRANGNYSIAKVTFKSKGIIFRTKKETYENYSIRIADKGRQQLILVQGENGATIDTKSAKIILDKIAKEIKY